MKIAPFVKTINKYNDKTNGPIQHKLIHTSPLYDEQMSNAFFHQLGIPPADINLGVGSVAHAEQISHTMVEFEKMPHSEKPVPAEQEQRCFLLLSPDAPYFIFNIPDLRLKFYPDLGGCFAGCALYRHGL